MEKAGDDGGQTWDSGTTDVYELGARVGSIYLRRVRAEACGLVRSRSTVEAELRCVSFQASPIEAAVRCL